MSAKPEATPAPEGAVVEAAPSKGGGGALMPMLIAIVVAPALSWAVAQFVLIPQLKKSLETPAEAGAHAEAAEAPKPAAKEGGHGKGKGEAASPGNNYTFDGVVVNLAGTMGTRYLKVTFLVTGADVNLKATFEEKRPQLLDVTLNVLSSLSLADLEEAGAKNLIREKLVQSYNQALGRKVAEQIFFSDFVVQ